MKKAGFTRVELPAVPGEVPTTPPTAGIGTKRSMSGFTLMELIVVTAVLGTLAMLMFPALLQARETAGQQRCASNLRQLVAANTLYAIANGTYIAASSDILFGNLARWHGRRTSLGEPFEASRGPLADYLDDSGNGITSCPAFDQEGAENRPGAFEASCGAYGYNSRGVGSQVYHHGFNVAGVSHGMKPSQIRRPAATVMFSDTALPQPYSRPTHLVEYSFAEAYFFVESTAPVESSYPAWPSIHFRHRGLANVAWCDGHVSAERMETEYGADFTRFNIGWFGGADNELFDPY